MKCWDCGTEMEFVSEMDTMTFEGKKYEYETEYYKCPYCGHVFHLINYKNEIHSAIRRKIREENGMLQPDEITRRRIACGVGSKEFWNSLKLVIPLWHQYYLIEGGSLQTKEQDKAIRGALEALEAETEGKRVFPLWIYGQDFDNEVEPERLFWLIEYLCFVKPTTEGELLKKLIYFDSKESHFTGLKDKEMLFPEVVLDYMVNVLKTLSVTTVDGVEYYESTTLASDENINQIGILGNSSDEINRRMMIIGNLRAE